MSDPPTAVLSVDLEVFTQTPAYRAASGTIEDDTVGLAAIDFLREVLAAKNAKASAFVVSSIAERYPRVVTRLADDGHEIASHTHTHALLTDLDRGERRDELERSRAILADVSGQPVRGFRAPAFDLPRDHFEVLADAGYGYDSSIAPCRSIPGWYGGEHDTDRPGLATEIDPGAPPEIAELPVSVMPGLRLPLTGAWLRFFGPRYTALGMHLLARRGITPVLYVHPWELVDLPAIEGVPKRVYWRTGTWTRRAIRWLLDRRFEFVTAATAIENTGLDPGSMTELANGGDAIEEEWRG